VDETTDNSSSIHTPEAGTEAGPSPSPSKKQCVSMDLSALPATSALTLPESLIPNSVPSAVISVADCSDSSVASLTTEAPVAHPKMTNATPSSVTSISGTVVSTTTTVTESKTKRPQMRYEPDVPMTKEEAAIWRREQRRKRNRESAAASRQRQRDRITELEEEVEGWKTKFDVAMQRLAQLEQLHRMKATSVSPDIVSSNCSTSTDLAASNAISPCPSPELSSFPNPTEMEFPDLSTSMKKEEVLNLHLKEKIFRPAVKITGATKTSSLLPLSDSDDLIPDPCASSKIASTSSNSAEEQAAPVSPVLSDNADSVQRLTDEDLEFGDFLMDAAEWL